MESLGEMLNEAQRTASVHRKLVPRLLKLRRKNPAAFLTQLGGCLQHALLVDKKDPAIERVLSFVVSVLTRREAGYEADTDELLEQLLGWLLELAPAKEKTVRYRVMQLAAGVINATNEDAELPDDLLDTLRDAMMARLRDKVPAVRVQAARGLARLQFGDAAGTFEDDAVTLALRATLAAERSKDVRKAALSSLAISDATVGDVLARTCDVAEDVRRMAFKVMTEKVAIDVLSIAQRAAALQRGLRDRSPPARAAAAAMLAAWLRQCGGDVLVLLARLDAETHEPVAEEAVKELLTLGLIDAAALAAAAAEAGAGLRRDPAGEAGLLTPEEALLWRVLVEALAGQAAAHGGAAAAAVGAAAAVAAAATDARLEALEAALPASAGDAVALLAAHARAGPAARFAARQLLLVLRCVDLADGAGCRAAAALLRELLDADPLAEQPPAAGAGGGGGGTGDGPAAAAAAAAAGRLAGAGGDGAWERAVVAAARHVHAAPGAYVAAMLEGTVRCAAAWGLVPAAAGELADAATAAAAAAVPGGRWVQALTWLSLTLEEAPSLRSLAAAAAAAGLPAGAPLGLAHAALRHPSAPARREAVRCVGLHALLEGAAGAAGAAGAGPALAVLRAALAADARPVAAVAAAALADLALLRGPAALDAHLPPPAPGGGSGSGGIPSSPGDVPVVAALMAIVEAAVAAAAAAAAGGDGGAGDAEALEEEAEAEEEEEGELAGAAVPPGPLAVAAEGLAKLLLFDRVPDGEGGAGAAGDAAAGGLAAAGANGPAAAAPPTGAGLGEAERALAKLLLLYFGRASEPRPRLRQCLAVFFEAYAAASAAHKRALGRALLPAARAAAAGGAGGRKQAGGIARYVLQLLQTPTRGSDAAASASPASAGGASSAAALAAEGHAATASLLLSEVLRCPVGPATKSYIAALARVAAKLRLSASDGAQLLAKLTWQVTQARARAVPADRPTARELGELGARLQALTGAGGAPLEAAALAVLLQASWFDQQLEAAAPAPFGGAGGGAGGEEGEEEEEDDEEDGEEGEGEGGEPGGAAATAAAAPAAAGGGRRAAAAAGRSRKLPAEAAPARPVRASKRDAVVRMLAAKLDEEEEEEEEAAAAEGGPAASDAAADGGSSEEEDEEDDASAKRRGRKPAAAPRGRAAAGVKAAAPARAALKENVAEAAPAAGRATRSRRT